jgi:hypothetical protein
MIIRSGYSRFIILLDFVRCFADLFAQAWPRWPAHLIQSTALSASRVDLHQEVASSCAISLKREFALHG